jgi:hypothetical protein
LCQAIICKIEPDRRLTCYKIWDFCMCMSSVTSGPGEWENSGLKISSVIYSNIKHFPCWYTVISTRVEFGRSVFIQFRVFPTSTSVDITIYHYGKNVLYFFYNIAMSKARRIRKISVFTSGGKFPVLTLSYINTALSQSAFRIYKCYIINTFMYYLKHE